MTRVGERPRQREGRPSWRAILRRPSRVDVKFFRRAVSTAQSFSSGEETEGSSVRDGEGEAMQKLEVLLTQKTSRQHAETPRLGGSFAKFEGRMVEGAVEDVFDV